MEVTGQPHALASLLLEKQPLYESSIRLVGSRNQFGYLKEKNSVPLPGNQTLITQLSLVTILTLKTANTLIIFSLAATLNKTKLHYTSKK